MASQPRAGRVSRVVAATAGVVGLATLAAATPAPLLLAESGAGLEVFPPPGTKPVKRGIIVPDGYALPPGYLRHYQTMDDGTRLPPILMFHPDFQPKDAHGRPVEVPGDRIVPPELAPPGMPVKMLELPAKPGAPDRVP